ncbi:MAG: glycosyltransferase [Lachnospiraceae bacterium]|nr:glycosyltransferase [Lachnospiraceae bacterium]
MKFTVVTVTFNSGTKLTETIKNVLKQNYGDFEVLVKDGGSNDDSLAFLKDYLEKEGYAEKSEGVFEKRDAGCTLRIVSEKDGGIYDAMNRAVKLAKGEYISFMNCGDYYASDDVLKRCAEVMEKTGNREIYYGDAYFRKVGNVLHMPKEITPSICYRHIPNHQSCFFKRELWRGKQLNPKFKIRADYEFFLYHFFEKDVRPVYLGVTVCDYEGGGYSETKENRKRDAYEHRVITEKYMTKKQLRKEKAFRILTLQPIRKWVAHKSPLSGVYDKVKKSIYR